MIGARKATGTVFLAALAFALAAITHEARAQATPSPRTAMDIPTNLQTYYVALFREGATHDDARALALMRDHLAYSRQQSEAGRFVLFGPVKEAGSLVGVTIIAAQTLDEAKALALADPAVAAGAFTVEVHAARFPPIVSRPSY